MSKPDDTCASCSPTVPVHTLEACFARYGTFLGRASATTLLLIMGSYFVAIGILGSGMALLTSNNDSEFLFTPVDSQAHYDREVMRETFPFNSSGFGAVIVFREDRSNVWGPTGIDLLNRIHAEVLYIETDAQGRTIRYDDVCEREPSGDCATDIPMRCLPQWNADQMFVPNESVPISFPVCIDQSTGSGILVPTRLGDPALSQNGQVAVGAEALRATYRLSYDREDEVAEELVSAWELAFTDRLEAWEDKARRDGTFPEGYTMTRDSGRAVNDALEASTSGDFLFISLTFVMLCVLVSILSFSPDPVRNKSILAQGGVLATAIAIPAGFGVCSFAGLPFVSIVGVSPFLLLALGIDNALVLTATYLRTPSRHSAEVRMRETLRDAGVAITLTTTTDVLAFGLGGISPFNSVRIFCAFTAACLFFAYISMLVVFAPLMVLDARREEAGLSSITCQPVESAQEETDSRSDLPTGGGAESAPAEHPAAYSPVEPIKSNAHGATESVLAGEMPEVDGKAASNGALPAGNTEPRASAPASFDADQAQVDAENASKHGSGDEAAESSAASANQQPSPTMSASGYSDENYVGAWWDLAFAEYLGPVVLSTPGKVVVFVLWLAMLGGSIYGFVNVEQGLDLQLLAPNGHFFIDAQDAQIEFYNLGIPFDVVAPNPRPGYSDHVNYGLAAVRSAIDSLGPAYVAADDFAESSDTIWIGPFHQFLEGLYSGLSTEDFDAPTLRGHLAAFLSNPAASGRVADTISFRDPSSGDIYKPGADTPQVVAAIQAGTEIEIAGTLMTVRSRTLDGSQEQADAMISLRKTLDEESKRIQRESGENINADSIVLSLEQLVFFEQFAIIVPSTLQTVFLAVAAILCVAAVLLPRLNAIGIVVLALASVLVMLFGFMYAVNIKLNSISSINLVLAIGLSVDAVAHVTHAFLASGGKHKHANAGSIAGQKSVALRWQDEPCFGGDMRHERAISALKNMGRPVFQGGLSSLLGLALLYAGASSYIFEVFAQLLGAVIILGLLHAVFVLPVLLATIGPGPILVEEEDDDAEEGGADGATSLEGYDQSSSESKATGRTGGEQDEGGERRVVEMV